jgi:hypothetical protein
VGSGKTQMQANKIEWSNLYTFITNTFNLANLPTFLDIDIPVIVLVV